MKRAYTLTDLLVSIGVIGLLTAITLPALRNSKEQTRDTTCKSQLHQWGVAFQSLSANDKKARYIPFDNYDCMFSQLEDLARICPTDTGWQTRESELNLRGSYKFNLAPQENGDVMWDYKPWHSSKRNYLKTDGSVR